MKNQTENTQTRITRIKLEDAIADLEVIDTLCNRGRITEANEMLTEIYQVAMSILGGNETIRNLLDTFHSEWSPRYLKVAEALS